MGDNITYGHTYIKTWLMTYIIRFCVLYKYSKAPYSRKAYPTVKDTAQSGWSPINFQHL